MGGTAVAVAVLFPEKNAEPGFAQWELPLGTLIGNPAAVWMVGRWLIAVLFPPKRLPRGFPLDDVPHPPAVTPGGGMPTADSPPHRSADATPE